MPVYNTDAYLEESIQSLLDQTLDFQKNIELVLINDGSKDRSGQICREFSEKYSENIIYIEQENHGLIYTRNLGLKKATGKYIAFLDSDDTLTPETLENVVTFFDEHYDEIDLVTYKIVKVTNGVKSTNLHYRYRYLVETGIYDLNDFNNTYVGLTNICYTVKNKFENNVLFDSKARHHEDQKFSMDVVREKMKIGYIENGEYLYRQNPNSVTNTFFHAYYLFDCTIQFWEDFFYSFDCHVPRYYQSLYMNDLAWKSVNDILKPYQYEGDKFKQEFGRVLKLLDMVDDSVILNHPGITEYYKYYFINLKKDSNLKGIVGEYNSSLAIMNNDNLIFGKEYVDLNILKMKRMDDQIYFMGFIRNPVFPLVQKPKLQVYLSDRNSKITPELRDSSYSIVGKEEVTKAYLFEVFIDIDKAKKIDFKVMIGSCRMNTKLSFAHKTIFSDSLKKYDFVKDGYHYQTDSFSIMVEPCSKKEESKYRKKIDYAYYLTDKKRWAARRLAEFYRRKGQIWLYYDCKGVYKDNGYYQFIHDFDMKDGIKRYFVTTHTKKQQKELFTRKQRRYLIPFNSLKHKMMYLNADKIITAYIESNNCSPYTPKSFINYIDLSKNPEIIYLQHGVLHAHTPWKYSLDRLLIDKEVVSTVFERKNLIENYAFTEKHLIKSGMPRYDFAENVTKTKKVILFAPSWRKYLIGSIKGEWIAKDSQFLESTFYKETQKFLNSKKLKKLLEKYDYVFHFKLHPIFKCYEHLYDIDNDRVVLETKDYKDDEYAVFITDYSSFVYDFVYLKRPIVYFFPDYDLFKAGLNFYREIDLPLEEGFGELCITADQLLKRLTYILENNCKDEPLYQERSEDFFLHYDNHQRDRIYEDLMKKD